MHLRKIRSKPSARIEADLRLLTNIINIHSANEPRQTAHLLLQAFGGFNGVLNASRRELLSTKLLSVESIDALKLVAEACLRIVKGNIVDRPIIANYGALRRYLLAKLDGLELSCLLVLYFDGAWRLLADVHHTTGTTDHVLFFPREIISEALQFRASGILLAQNRASGTIKATVEDLECTEDLRKAADVFGLSVLDHVIVANGEICSLRPLFRVLPPRS